MKRYTVSGSGSESEVVIASGDCLTVETTTDFSQLILRGLAEENIVAIEFEPSLTIDITALQMFCSACSKATAEGKKFIHRGPPPQALLDLAAAAGSERHEHCINNNTSCFRQFGGEATWEK